MRVELAKITNKGFKFQEKIKAADWSLDGFDVKFIGQIKVECELKKEYNRIVSNGHIITHREINCSRCLIQVCQVKKHRFERIYQLGQLSDFLDIEKDIREEILLNFSLKALCFADCRGLCPGCGKNLNWEKCIC